jgi:hypothetical protein
MTDRDERERLARLSAAQDSDRKCHNGHAIVGNNIYRTPSSGGVSCLLCRIEWSREHPRRPRAPRQRKVPLSPALRRALREAAGLPPNDDDADA